MQHTKPIAVSALLAMAITLSGCGDQAPSSADASAAQGTEMEKSVAEYIKSFPYQDSYDYAIRYYLPGEAIRSGDWRMPKAKLQSN